MTINVRVHPKSSRQFLDQSEGGGYEAYLKSAPVDDKANKELIHLLAKEFGIKKYQVEIIKGAKSRDKVVSLDIE